MLASKMKSKLKARRKIVKASDMIEHFESKGIQVNKESIRARSKSRRGIADLEDKADKNASKALDSDDDGNVMTDAGVASKEAELRGRKRRRAGSDADMDDSDENEAAGKKGRSKTPAQLKISAHKILRSKSKDRREGSVPKRLPYKLVPEEHIRLAKKINKKFKHGQEINEADRTIPTKRPKRLFSGKSNLGTSHHR